MIIFFENISYKFFPQNFLKIFSCFYRKKKRPKDTAPKRYVAQTLLGGWALGTKAPKRYGAQSAAPKRAFA